MHAKDSELVKEKYQLQVLSQRGLGLDKQEALDLEFLVGEMYHGGEF